MLFVYFVDLHSETMAGRYLMRFDHECNDMTCVQMNGSIIMSIYNCPNGKVLMVWNALN
jgi:hypothetical protein